MKRISFLSGLPKNPFSFAVKGLAALALAVVVAGCTQTVTEIKPTRWQNPELPEERWVADRSACLDRADREAARLLRDPVSSTDIGRSPSRVQQSLDQIEARQRKAQLFEACMRQRGYRPIDGQ